MNGDRGPRSVLELAFHKRGIQSCLDACSQSAHRRISYRLVREVFEPAALADNGVRHAVAHIELAAHLRVFTYGETRANKGAGSFVCPPDFNPLGSSETRRVGKECVSTSK